MSFLRLLWRLVSSKLLGRLTFFLNLELTEDGEEAAVHHDLGLVKLLHHLNHFFKVWHLFE